MRDRRTKRIQPPLDYFEIAGWVGKPAKVKYESTSSWGARMGVLKSAMGQILAQNDQSMSIARVPRVSITMIGVSAATRQPISRLVLLPGDPERSPDTFRQRCSALFDSKSADEALQLLQPGSEG